MNQEYRLDREYSIAEIIQCNLRKWWLALICAAVCAAVLGGYKYKSLKPFIEQSVYENVKQVTATLYVADYSTSASTERANNVIKMAQSYRAYELVQQKTGCDLDYKTYQGIFDALQREGYRVPEDFSLCGFDNVTSSGYQRIQLTSVENYTFNHGKSAFNLLLERIEGGLNNREDQPINRVEYRSRLIVRGSTGKPRSGSL